MTKPTFNPRPRFSLLTLVLLTTIVALGVTVGLLYRELAPLRAEVSLLRDELGDLNVGDKTKLHVIRAETDNKLHWKWRIWIPEGKEYIVRGVGEDIPKEGWPPFGSSIALREPGEQVVEWVIQYDPEGDRWAGHLQHEGSKAGNDTQPWVQWTDWSSSSHGVETLTKVFETDKTVELYRMRCTNDDDPPKSADDPLPGFMIWLEPR